MNEAPASLIVKVGPNPEKEYPLSQTEITIGRGSGNVIVIPNPDVSRRHARIRRDGDDYYIEDWGSTNGTFVSNQRTMSLTILRNGDEIRLGDSIILQYINESSSVTPPYENQILGSNPEVTIVDEMPPPPSPEIKIPALIMARSDEVQELSKDEFILPDQQDPTNRNRLRLLNCGCIVLLMPLLCVAILVFLDFYQQGRLLYCGPIRPFFEILLGPLGFAPICP